MYFDAQTIVAALPAIRPLVIAIDGGSGSGKTTLGQELAAALSAPLMSLDDFIIEVSDEVLDQRSPEQNFLEAFNRQAIADALSQRRASLNLTVVEGVYSHRPEWAGLIDFRIWIEMSSDRRLKRMKDRQANTDSQMRLWQATEDWYIKMFEPAAACDLRVDGTTGKRMQKSL